MQEVIFKVNAVKEVAKMYIKMMFKGTLSGLKQSLATESSLKMIKNAFYCI